MGAVEDDELAQLWARFHRLFPDGLPREYSVNCEVADPRYFSLEAPKTPPKPKEIRITAAGQGELVRRAQDRIIRAVVKALWGDTAPGSGDPTLL